MSRPDPHAGYVAGLGCGCAVCGPREPLDPIPTMDQGRVWSLYAAYANQRRAAARDYRLRREADGPAAWAHDRLI